MNDSIANRPKKPVTSYKRRQQSRREFIRTAALAVGVIGVSLLGLLPVAQGHSLRLRPPGALKTPDDEQRFLSSCIKCGQCVQVCPVEAIRLSDLLDGCGLGTPYIDPRAQACDFSCDGIQCVLACPTGSLTHDLDYPADTRMGLARLDRPDGCLAMLGQGFKGLARGAHFTGKLRYEDVDRWTPIPVTEYPYDLDICDLCVRQCPIEIRIAQCALEEASSKAENTARVAQKVGHECPPKHAIRLEPVGDGSKAMRPVVLEGCVGCGVCEMICPVAPAAILIDIHKTSDSV